MQGILDPSCFSSGWSECSQDCSRSRQVANRNDNQTCIYREETEPCFVAHCPPNDGDQLLSFDLILAIDVSIWSVTWKERVAKALSKLLHTSLGCILISEDFLGFRTILHVRSRLSAAEEEKGVQGFQTLTSLAFGEYFTAALVDKDDLLALSSFGWLRESQVRCTKVLLQEIHTSVFNGTTSLPFRIDNLSVQGRDGQTLDLLAGCLILSILICVYCLLYRLVRNKVWHSKKELKI